MIARLRHKVAVQQVCACDESLPADPTGTAALRRKHKRVAKQVWLQVTNALRKVVVDQDFFGLAAPRGNALVMRIVIDPVHRASAFDSFVKDVLKTVEIKFDPMLREAYAMAVARAMRLSNVQRIPYQSQHMIYIKDDANKDLEAIRDAVALKIRRYLTGFVDDGVTPVRLFMELSAIVDSIGVNRTNLLIDTFAIKAHVHGTLDQFEGAGIRSVGIQPERVKLASMFDARRGGGPGSRLKKGEQPSRSTLYRIRKAQKRIERRAERVDVLTAGDDDVCPVCEEISENGPYTINRARDLIPAHPSCRCAFIPADDERYASVREEDDDE